MWVCPKDECQAKMLPTAVPDIYGEWLSFHKTRKAVTTLKQAGLNTTDAFAHLRMVGTGGCSMQVLEGLERCYKEPKARKTYDPEFADPAYFQAVSNLQLALHSPGAVLVDCLGHAYAFQP